IFCWNGGVLVGATPDIVYLKDTKGDGKADLRETVFTGFAEGVERTNVQELMNSMVWSLDNRIHGATSGHGGMVKSLRHPELKPINLHGRDFVIEPRTMTMTTEIGGGQHGLSFDDYGRRFTCNNSDHIRYFQYDDHYAARNPYYTMPPALASIAVDGPAAEVYRISPEEAWRVIRTRWRVASLVSGPVEGGGRSSGYFTGATGITIYRGDAFPKEFLDNAFIGECAGNLLSRKLLIPDDVTLKAQRAPDEQNVEFLASTDNWFRPVQFANAPDGTLYLIDMHREIVEHPWSLPDNIKKLIDLNSGSDCGRIFRIVPDGFKQPELPHLDKATTAELVAALESPNGWTRDTAARLIYERQDKSAAPLLAKLAAESKFPLARIHALHALDGLGELQKEHVLKAVGDSEPWVRIHAVKLAENFPEAYSSGDALINKLLQMPGDPSNLVRYQLAFTLGELLDGRNIKALAEIARQDAASPLIQAAVLSSLKNGAGDVFAILSADATFAGSKPGQEFLRQLVALVGAKHQPDEVSGVMSFIQKVSDPALSFSLIRGLGDGLKRGDSSLEKVVPASVLESTFAKAVQMTAEATTGEATRTEAIQLLAFSDYKQAGATLTALLKPGTSEDTQLAAIDALGHFSDAEIPTELTQHWKGFSPRVKSRAVSVLLSRPERALVLLQAVASGIVLPNDLTTPQSRFLRNHENPDVRKLALQVLGTNTAKQRQAVVDEFQPALALKGDAVAGRKIFEQRCVSCHHLDGLGFAVGPDLLSVKSNGKDKILISILDPSREVAPQYIAFQVDTKDGESSVGIIANESTSGITVRQAYGKEDVIPRSNIKGMKSQQQSLMPEGLEQGLSKQDVANLLEFIIAAK
ncbi:MAG TPA: PVC-type heme-binding CxxCH protein, partial [Verrucomicrobiae bacterium]|nr:PVC-type heme-binding CxxCH protein [Verrucomicrobiae bacterium]